MIGARLSITLFLVIAVMFQRLRDQMEIAVLFLIAGLLVLSIQTNQARTLRLRAQAFVDLAIFLAVVPAIVLTGFVAAQTGDLLPAERSALLETSTASLLTLLVFVGICYRLFHYDRPMLAAALLPGWLIVISLTFVLHEYRNQTVIAMIAVSYFIGTVAVALGALVEEPVRRYVAATFYGSTLLVGAVLFDPGIGNLGDRATVIQVVIWTLVMLGIVVLIVVPNPSFEPRNLLAGFTEGSRRSQPNTVRRQDDPGRATEG